VSAHSYLVEILEHPPTVRLSAPVTVVAAGDDASTSRAGQLYQQWQVLAEQVELHELENGGHYFLRTRPADAAHAVLRHTRELISR
jgi:surfactin synthase thioesterase subunit